VPAAVHEPAATDDVVAIVSRAAESGQRVKVIGGGHSFTDAAMTDGHLVSLDGMNRILEVDGADVTVQAGFRLRDLNAQLSDRGLALPNLGDIDRQSIAGRRPRQRTAPGRGLVTWPRPSSGWNWSPATARWSGPTSGPIPNCCVSRGSASARSAC
jgi:L-gulonolactone oxidase